MRLKSIHKIIKKQMTRLGVNCYVVDENGEESTVYAFLIPVWHRTKSKFEPVITPMGEMDNDYRIYYGPSDFDITKLTRNCTLVADGIKYYFVKTDRIEIGGELKFCSGVLKRLYEEELAYVY